jgi:hypothetical protein
MENDDEQQNYENDDMIEGIEEEDEQQMEGMDDNVDDEEEDELMNEDDVPVTQEDAWAVIRYVCEMD